MKIQSRNIILSTDYRNKLYFTLIELLIVISIIMILGSMLLPALNKAKNTAKKIECLGNHRQITTALLMYANDYNEYWLYSPMTNLMNAKYYDTTATLYTTYSSRPRFWPGQLIFGNYCKQRRSYGGFAGAFVPNAIDFSCPSLQAPSTKMRWMDYSMNMVTFADGWHDSMGDGPGGVKSNPGYSCKLSQIRKPSELSVLVDRWDNTISNDSSGTQTNYFYKTDSFPTVSQSLTASDNYAANPYNHNKGSNYSFADGHCVWRHFRDIRWKDFHIEQTKQSTWRLY